MSVRIFPRRKAGENCGMEKGRAPLNFDKNSIQPLSAMPQKDAARTLGISLTALKKVCRKLGIHSWAHVRDARVGPDAPLHRPATPAVELNSIPICKPAHAKVSNSLDAFLGAVDDDISMGSPIPEDSDDVMCEDLPTDFSARSSSMASSRIQVDAGINKADSSPCHDSNDLAYLVPLPSGFIDVPDDETYTNASFLSRWLTWYEESSKSFDC